MTLLLIGSSAQADIWQIPYLEFVSKGQQPRLLSEQEFYNRAARMQFPVSSWKIDSLNPVVNQYRKEVYPWAQRYGFRLRGIDLKGAASPEGPRGWNYTLGRERAMALVKAFGLDSLGGEKIDTANVLLNRENLIEDYRGLVRLLRERHDPLADYVEKAIRRHGTNTEALKAELKANRATWRHLLHDVFPALRASRMMIYLEAPWTTHWQTVQSTAPDRMEVEKTPLTYIRLRRPSESTGHIFQTTDDLRMPRRHVLALRTNLLYDCFYYPDYGMAPTPTFALEFYPLRGHVTYNVRLMLADWERWSEHKFWQIQDLSFEARYYLHRRTAPRDAGIFSSAVADRYKGFFLGLYAQANRYGIGFDEKRGWEGEGYGGGLSLGYVLPICKSQRCRLEFTAAAGGYVTYYDPYIYGNPFTGEKDGLYYYDTDLYRDKFRKRQHRLTWFGPTELGIHFTWDVLYRKIRKGVSFRRWEPAEVVTQQLQDWMLHSYINPLPELTVPDEDTEPITPIEDTDLQTQESTSGDELTTPQLPDTNDSSTDSSHQQPLLPDTPMITPLAHPSL